MKQLRASLYFSHRKDKDIIEELDFPSLEQGDINWKIKELLRDGIKYRHTSRRESSPVIERPMYVPQEFDLPTVDFDFDNIEVKRKELSEEDILSKLGEI